MSPIRPSHNLNVPSAGKHLFPLYILRWEVSTRLGTGHRWIYQRPAPRITILFMFFFRDLLFPCGIIIILLIFYSRSRNWISRIHRTRSVGPFASPALERISWIKQNSIQINFSTLRTRMECFNFWYLFFSQTESLLQFAVPSFPRSFRLILGYSRTEDQESISKRFVNDFSTMPKHAL